MKVNKILSELLGLLLFAALVLLLAEAFVWGLDRSPTMTAYGRMDGISPSQFGDVTRSLIAALRR